MERIERDVIIVAAGPAGLAAAITTCENNLSTIVFEKANTTGGAANMGMGPLGIGTKIQKKNFINLTKEQALNAHMEYTHCRVDAELVEAYFGKSADTIEWLQDMGVEFHGAYKYYAESEATWHIVKSPTGFIGPRAAGTMIKCMTDRAQELGAEIRLNTPVKRLIMQEDRVVGVVAADQAGNEIEAYGKAVVVATGGFVMNAEMLKEHFGYTLNEDFFPFTVPGVEGDGLNMMWEIGAQKYGANIEMIYSMKDGMEWGMIEAAMRQPNLLLNQRGERFMNEAYLGNTTFAGNAINLQPGRYAYSICDGGILNYYKKHGPDILNIVFPAEVFEYMEETRQFALEDGYDCYFEADTVEELAEQLGIDPTVLADQIDTYNDMCDRGYDDKFGKPREFLHPITGKGKYRASKYYVSAYGTIGGVRINKYCQVLDCDQKPIKGLYSAGSDANTIYGDSYNFSLPGNTMGFAINSGRMAGEAIADELLR